MKKIIRRAVRAILKYLCILSINKNKIDIICVCGWHNTDIVKDEIYSILKKNGKAVRRNKHTPIVDWDIPLAILNIHSSQINPVSIFHIIILAIYRLLFLKASSSILTLQINTQDAGIMKYWMSFLNPSTAVMLNSHPGTLNLELLVVYKLKPKGLLILNNDNIRTKSLSQGRSEDVIYFGEKKSKVSPDYFYYINKINNSSNSYIGHGKELNLIEKSFPEHLYPYLTAGISITDKYSIDFKDACNTLNGFDLTSEKMQNIFHKYIEE